MRGRLLFSCDIESSKDDKLAAVCYNTAIVFKGVCMVLRIALLLAVLLNSVLLFAQEAAKTTYYAGLTRIILLDGPYNGTIESPALLKKVNDRTAGTITETATIKGRKGAFEDQTMILLVVGNMCTVKSEDGSITGSGELVGTDWDWHLLQLSAEDHVNKVKICVANYLLPSRLIARKVLSYDYNNRAFMLWESDLDVISAEAYEARYRELHQGK